MVQAPQKANTLLKIIALLSKLRWYNLLMMGATLLLCAVFLFNHFANWRETLTNPNLWFISLAALLIMAGGFIVNNFYDLERDLINRPKTTMFENLVSTAFSLKMSLALMGLGCLVALVSSLNVGIYFFAFAFSFWFYSHKLQFIPVVKEISAALLTVMPVLSLMIYYNSRDQMIVQYGIYFFQLILLQQISKASLNKRGDLILGNATIATLYRSKDLRIMAVIIAFILVGNLLLMISTELSEFAVLGLAFGAYISLSLGVGLLINSKQGTWPLPRLFRLKFLILWSVLLVIPLGLSLSH